MQPFDIYNSYDIQLEKASGSELVDTAGNTYLDLYGGHAVISVGHGHPSYVKAITSQLQEIGFYSNAIRMPLQEQLAEKLGNLSGYPEYSLFLCNSGAEANENAFKLASFHTGRKKIIGFHGSFHGRTSLALAATDNPSLSAPVNHNEHVILLPPDDIEAVKQAIDSDTCAVIIEGIQGVSGIHVPSAAFLQQLAVVCRENGTLLILDEVQSGYGRTGLFFAHQHAGIRPDLITIAKGMGNGFPVAGVLISPEIKAQKELLGTTFGGNYLACAAALSVLNILEEEQLMEHARETGNYLIERLSQLPGVKAVRGKGLMIGIELYEPVAGIRKELLFTHRMFTGGSSCPYTIRILPSLSIRKTQIDQFLEAFSAIPALKAPITNAL
jgi:acetylornithine/N-succinyldiaminopimelate aminotransferase